MEHANPTPAAVVRQSSMRMSTRLAGKASTVSAKKIQIKESRGAFKYLLPVFFVNDMVHGSWWMLWGSALSTIIPIFPLLDIYLNIFTVPENTNLHAFDESATWIFFIVSGIFFTVGSYVYVRANEEPTPPPYFNYYHLSTDELLASWLFLVATLPTIPYAIVYLKYNPYREVYWGTFIASILMVAGTAFFVYSSYPSEEVQESSHTVRTVSKKLFGKKSWLIKHVQTDWLAACWFCFWATLLSVFGCFLFLIQAENDRQIFVWLTAFIDSFLFLIGCAYYCAGSYPPSKRADTVDHDRSDGMLYHNAKIPSSVISSSNSSSHSSHSSRYHHLTDPTCDDIETNSNNNNNGIEMTKAMRRGDSKDKVGTTVFNALHGTNSVINDSSASRAKQSSATASAGGGRNRRIGATVVNALHDDDDIDDAVMVY